MIRESTVCTTKNMLAVVGRALDIPGPESKSTIVGGPLDIPTSGSKSTIVGGAVDIPTSGSMSSEDDGVVLFRRRSQQSRG